MQWTSPSVEVWDCFLGRAAMSPVLFARGFACGMRHRLNLRCCLGSCHFGSCQLGEWTSAELKCVRLTRPHQRAVHAGAGAVRHGWDKGRAPSGGGRNVVPAARDAETRPPHGDAR